MKLGISLIATAAVVLQTVHGYSSFKSRIPNGDRVPNPCQVGTIWAGVGHESAVGADTRNKFGLDFKAAGLQWTVDLCRKDSDGDGLTNGQELGDPDCVWKVGATPARTTGLSHPGICEFGSTKCSNAWNVCPKAFSCPAMNDPSVTVRNFTINKNTPVPAKETTYVCQAFELNNTATPVHLIGSKPIIDNKNVMHHMIMYACSSKPNQTFFDAPQECFMARSDCNEIVNLWAFGLEGECYNNNTGYRIGGEGYRYAMLELHWNNPAKLSTYTDSSGLALYFTPNLRKYDQGTAMYGEGNLVLPPRQPVVNFNHTCPSVCTEKYHTETRYITGAGIHMHGYGVQGRISLWRNGTLVKDLHPLQAYDYNSPKMNMFDPPIEYRRGDEVKTECYFSTLKSNKTIYFGEGTSDEMCLSFLSYYPNNVSKPNSEKLGSCIAVSGINMCWVQSGIEPHIERECNITDMRNGNLTEQVSAEMTANGCFSKTGCNPKCRDYLNNTLWPSNACYDPKRALQMTETMATGYLINQSRKPTFIKTLYGQSFCQQEVAMLSTLDQKAATISASTTPTTNQVLGSSYTGLKSEHLLIIIIVCSCLGFIIIIAILGVAASKLGGDGFPKPTDGADKVPAAGPQDNKAYLYNEYENSASGHKTQL
ncbi:hypothetical protein BOX15_Mlig028174g1 [Macrostomum lignano]|uniref:DOMON domain-containing protein n=2 Tax=Macrostomum lignano TaxID=282301 RepID=A0A267FVW2_9PLAT|nr:hypothetical protein BOX15_Mlig028174g2 [Macrostomum lignano]PAA83483.1 hypothetical protein BOX15_Mlig028174g1 [Macrostomum lignano]